MENSEYENKKDAFLYEQYNKCNIVIDSDRRYGIDGQYIHFYPILLEEGDRIVQDGTVLRYMGNDDFVLMNEPITTFVPAIKLTKKWTII